MKGDIFCNRLTPPPGRIGTTTRASKTTVTAKAPAPDLGRWARIIKRVKFGRDQTWCKWGWSFWGVFPCNNAWFGLVIEWTLLALSRFHCFFFPSLFKYLFWMEIPHSTELGTWTSREIRFMKSYKLIDPHIRYSECHIHNCTVHYIHVWMVFFAIEETLMCFSLIFARQAPQPKATVPSRGGVCWHEDEDDLHEFFLSRIHRRFFPPPQTLDESDSNLPQLHANLPKNPDPRSCRSSNFQWGGGGTSAPRKALKKIPADCQARPAATSPPAGPELQP